MARAQLSNNASTTLASGISNSATSLSVASGAGALFPAISGANYFYATLKEGALVEIVKVTARSTDAFTVVRAQDGTTGQTFTAAATVKLNLTAAVFAELPALATSNSFAGAQIGGVTALTSSAASMAIDLAVNNNFSHTTSENTTLAAPSNPVAGQSGVITITQGATARTLAYNTFWKFAGGTIPSLTATIGAIDVFAYYVETATRATCQLIKDVK